VDDLARGGDEEGRGGSITARYAEYAHNNRGCIPRVRASAFSRGDRRTRT